MSKELTQSIKSIKRWLELDDWIDDFLLYEAQFDSFEEAQWSTLTNILARHVDLVYPC